MLLCNNYFQVVEVKNVVLNVNVAAIQLVSNVTNGSTIISNASLFSSSGAASLIFAGSKPLFVSGKISMFLPEFIVLVNISTNYTRIRVILQATSPSLLFVSGDTSFVEVVPKCAIGMFVASSGASYDCIKCSIGTYSNQMDSRACRLVQIISYVIS